jgi:hypothetical protein
MSTAPVPFAFMTQMSWFFTNAIFVAERRPGGLGVRSGVVGELHSSAAVGFDCPDFEIGLTVGVEAVRDEGDLRPVG